MKNNIFVKIVGLIVCAIFINRCIVNTKHDKLKERAAIFSAPTKSPFVNNIGIAFSVEQTEWYNDKSIKYNNVLQNQYTFERLQVISKDFKLIHIYSFLVAGWESTGNITPEAYSLINVAKQDDNVEAVIGTSCNKEWFKVQANVQTFIDSLKIKFGSSIYQVKTILIGNEINANSYTQSDIATIMTNFRVALKRNKLNIPVTATFSNLPIQSGDAYSDSLVSAIVNGWDKNWNGNKPFVFIDPYPDASGINNAAGVYAWQYEVAQYYQSKYPSLQIFIGETGAEGSTSDYKTTIVIDSVFSQLTLQYDSIGKTVPTLLFEAVNESLKVGSPNQKYMGLYTDSNDPKTIKVKIKNNINLPTWFKK